MSEPGDWCNFPIALKFDWRINSTTAESPVQFQSDRDILISISRLRYFKKRNTNCLKTAVAPQGGTEKWLQVPFLRTSREHPPPPRCRGNTFVDFIRQNVWPITIKWINVVNCKHEFSTLIWYNQWHLSTLKWYNHSHTQGQMPKTESRVIVIAQLCFPYIFIRYQ